MRKTRGESNRLLGVAQAIRIIQSMNWDWPDAIDHPTLGERYGAQFVSRILESYPEARRYLEAFKKC